MNKKIITSISALAIMAMFFVMLGTSAKAYQGDYTKKGPNYSPERHEAMEKAFESNDYESWKKLMQGRGRVTQVINKDNFAKFAKAHELAEQGKVDEANAIRSELGLRTAGGVRGGYGIGRGYGKIAQ